MLYRVLPQEEQPTRNETVDRLLDIADEPVFIGGQPYAVSEALYATDPEAYQAVLAAVTESRNVRDQLSERYPRFLRPDIVRVSFIHYEDMVCLKVVDRDVSLTDTEFITVDDLGRQFFSITESPDYNADLLVNKFDPFSIINCFDLFTEQAASEIAELHKVGKLESLFSSTNDVRDGTE